jgi:hypothetical protein
MHTALYTLRNARTVAWLCLAWFVLFVGAASAAPLMKAGPTAVLCSASGLVKGIGNPDAGSTMASQHSIDCVLCCFTADAPPAPLSFAPPALPMGQMLQSIPAARIAAVTAAPLPPRGPPRASRKPV